jgi:hypothetical protein
MFYYFQDKHKLLEGNLEFKEHKYIFNSYEKELYSVVEDVQREKKKRMWSMSLRYDQSKDQDDKKYM